MIYKGGTAAAQQCIAKLSELGVLANVYTEHWLDIHPNTGYFSSKDLIQYQADSNQGCEGHLLVISTSLDDGAVGKLLTDAHSDFLNIFGPNVSTHKPDLVFINLATQQILCFGLGRKNQIFGYSLGINQILINDNNIYDALQPLKKEISVDPTLVFMRDFLKYDYAGITSSLIEALYEFGLCARAYDHLPLNPDLIDEIISAGPDNDGMFDIDDELMTLSEVQEIAAKFKQTDEMGYDNLITLQQFFPELTWGDMSTGDY